MVPDDPGGFFNIASLLADASPALMLAIFIIALSKGWLVLPRELENRDKRIVELVAEKDEYKRMAFTALSVGERVTAAVEKGNRT